METENLMFIGGPSDGDERTVETGDREAYACHIAERLPVTHIDYDPYPVGQAVKYVRASLNGVDVMVLASTLDRVCRKR